MLADLTSKVGATSAPRLSELVFHCWAKTADNVPHLGGGERRGHYAQMIFHFCGERAALALGYLVAQRIFLMCSQFLTHRNVAFPRDVDD